MNQYPMPSVTPASEALTLRDHMALCQTRDAIPEAWVVAMIGRKPGMDQPKQLMIWWSDAEALWRYTKADAMLRVRSIPDLKNV
jgi:hypothetical protein